MKNQRVRFERKFGHIGMLILAMMLLLSCGFVVPVFATGGTTAPEAGTVLSIQFKDGSEVSQTDGFWVKEYDGTSTIASLDDLTLTVQGQTNDLMPTITKVQFIAANGNETKNVDAIKLKITYQWEGRILTYTAPARIEKKQLTWNADKQATASVVYDPDRSTYTTTVAEAIDASWLVGIAAEDDVSISSVAPVSFETVDAAHVSAYTTVALSGADAENYIVSNLSVDVTVTPIAITDVIWTPDNQTASSYVYGDDSIFSVTAKGLIGQDAQGNPIYCPLDVKVYCGTDDEGNAVYYGLREAAEKGLYGSVKADGTGYTLIALTPDSELYDDSAVYGTDKLTKNILITKATYTVSVSDAICRGESDLSDPTSKYYQITAVQKKENDTDADIPLEILAQLTYTYFKDGAPVSTIGVNEPGIYTVQVNTFGVDANYSVNVVYPNDAEYASLIVLRDYLFVGLEDGDAQFVIYDEAGLPPRLTASLTLDEGISAKILRRYRVHQEYVLTVSGLETGNTFRLLIPISSELLADANCDVLTEKNLYLYDGFDTLTSANETYTVSLSADGAYYVVEGIAVSGNVSEMTFRFVLAPDYHAPFWVSIPGIALIILLVLLLLLLMFLIGLRLRRIERCGINPVLRIDTEGDVPAVVPVEIPDKIEDPDACIEEGLDDLAEALREDVPAEEEALDTDVDAGDAVADALKELTDEASTIELIDEAEEEDLNAAAQMTDAMAEEKANELQKTVDAAQEEATDEEVQAAVAEAMAENWNESADATEAIALMSEDEAEWDPEAIRTVIDMIVADAMTNTMLLNEETEKSEETSADATSEASEGADADSDICAMVADSVAEAFETVCVDGVAPQAVEGTTAETIATAVEQAAVTYVPDSWTEEMTAEVKTAVTDELIARLLPPQGPNDGEPASEEPIEEEAAEEPLTEQKDADTAEVDNDDFDEEESEEDDGDAEETSMSSFGSMPLTFIDAIADAEQYNDLLAQESRGEVQIVTRYRRSFRSRLAQSQGSVQDYYNAIKNLLLSYKGIKSRISWNYESFNLGRTQVAKFNAKTRTLYLYIALDPSELTDSKYGFKDMSSKKKYAAVPVLMKIKGDRKFKHTMELITMLCEEKLQLPKKKVVEEIDYRLPYMTTEELVNQGDIKKLVAAIPLNDAEPTASTVEAEATATEPSVAETATSDAETPNA